MSTENIDKIKVWTTDKNKEPDDSNLAISRKVSPAELNSQIEVDVWADFIADGVPKKKVGSVTFSYKEQPTGEIIPSIVYSPPTVDVDTIVLVDGSGTKASSPSAVINSWAWKVTNEGGMTYPVDNADKIQASFKCPDLNWLYVTLTVKDTNNKTASKKIRIDIGEPQPTENHPPIAVAGGDQTVKEKTTVTLDGSQSHDTDAGDSIVKYEWTQTYGEPLVQIINKYQSIAHFVAPEIVTEPPEPCPPGQHRDPVTGLCVPDEPEPPTDKAVIWDSNVHLKTGKKYTITDTYGSQAPDGKGVWMAASGDPRLIVDEDGTFHLEADAGHGRVYIRATNFNSLLEGELKFESSAIDNTTLRLRSRHNEGGACSNRFGGFGATVERQTAEYQTESCHNNHENSISKNLQTPLKDGQWYGFRYYCHNSPDNKSVIFKTQYDYKDGKGFVTVAEGSHNSPQSFYMDEASFKKESYVWLRINNEKTGSVAYRNVKIINTDTNGNPVPRSNTTTSTNTDTNDTDTAAGADAEEDNEEKSFLEKSVIRLASSVGDETKSLAFRLTVTDTKGATNSDDVIITVTKADIEPPVCPPGQHYDPVTKQCVPNEPPTGEEWIFAQIGDTHGEKEALQKLVQTHKPVFLVHTGDVTDTEKDDDNYIQYTKDLGLVYGQTFANSEGNHESKEESGEGAKGDLEDAFPILKENEWLQMYHIKNVVLIIGNTQAPGYSQLDSNAGKWLAETLPKARQLVTEGKADWIFLAQHKPFWTMKARHESEFNFRYNFHPLLDQYGVDLTMHGHNHDQQRTKPLIFNGAANAPPKVNDAMKDGAHDMSMLPHGIIVCINGSSSKLTSFSESPNAWTPYSNDNNNGYTIYKIKGKTLTGQYIETSSGKVLHEFRATK